MPVFGQKTIRNLDLNKRDLRWAAPITTHFTEAEQRSFLWFDGASYDAEKDYLPLFTERRQLPIGSTSATATIHNQVYEPLDQASIVALGSGISFLSEEPQVIVKFSISRREPFANVSIIPLQIGRAHV